MSEVSARSGAALAAVLVALLVIDCVVLGTMQLALLEWRVAENGLQTLRLRTSARSAAHLATARWDLAYDALEPGDRLERELQVADAGIRAGVTVERLAPALFVVRGRTQPVASPHAAGSAALLVVPPLLDPRFDPVAAALTARAVDLAEGGGITAAPDECTAANVRAVGVASVDAALPVSGLIAGTVERVHPDSFMTIVFSRIVDVARHAAATDGNAVALTGTDARYDEPTGGVHVVLGDAVVDAPFDGLLLVGGDVAIGAAGVVRGAVHARGSGHVAGHVVLDGCVVRTALDRAGLRRARLLPGRPVMPSF